MRQRIRAILTLVCFVAAVLWLADATLTRLISAWFQHDAALRVELAVTSANNLIAERWRTRDTTALHSMLVSISQDERVLGVAACDAADGVLTRTERYPADLSCEDALRGGRRSDPAGHDLALPRVLSAQDYLVSSVPVYDIQTLLGRIVFAHDMRYARLRSAQIRTVVFGALALFGVGYVLFSIAFGRMTRRSWAQELSRVLGGPSWATDFRPLLNDIKIMKARLDAERDASAEDRTWTPARLRDLVRDQLEGARIIVLANREPIIHNRAADGSIVVVRPASGLVSALEPVVRACAGTWVAHGSGSADRDVVDGNDRLIVPPGESPYTLRRVWLSEEEEQGYYYGFANEGLWPLCHIAHARPTFRTEDFEEYRAVNERFVDAVVEEVETDDPVILVQDYHFALAPKMLRERLPRATIVLFWHIPWPNAEAFGICPWRTELLEGMLGASIVGFHTQQHSNNFIEAVDGYLEARIDRERSAVVRNEQETLVRQYPISVEWPFRWAEDVPDALTCRDLLERRYALAPDALIGIGVDRLDYTKGIEERFRAVERLLERYPEYRGRFTFIQLAAPSRAIIPRYRDFTTSVVELANSINHRLGRPGYRPILLRLEHHEHAAIVTHYRAADFCYVSSLHDGMNLVAKEFVASRDDDQGVLLLSHFTGSARELTEALIVNPYDIDHASDAMARALTMAREEQRERMRAMRQQVREWNVFRWAGRLLIDASHERHRTLLADRLGRARALQPLP